MIGHPFVELNETASTNSYAIAQLQANLSKHGTAYFAHKQTAGKGQRGKTWNTEPSSNIILSIVLEMPYLSTQLQFPLSCSIALACHDFFSFYTQAVTKLNVENQANCSIKWPNDIYWGDKKAAGMLIENVYRGSDWKWAVVGIGMNINQLFFPESLPNPISLAQITGQQYPVIALAKELCGMVEKRWQQLLEQPSLLQLTAYNKLLYRLNKQVKFRKGAIVFEAGIKGVNSYGQLVIQQQGIESCIDFGTVEMVANV